eukprot:7920362-Pyramimonas_sp.AAC.1
MAAAMCGLSPVVTFLGAFGSPSPKPVQIWTNWNATDHIRRTKGASDRRLGGSKIKLAVDQARRTKAKRSDGTQSGWKDDRWVGGKKSRQGPSENYPLEFCHALALAAQHCLSDIRYPAKFTDVALRSASSLAGVAMLRALSSDYDQGNRLHDTRGRDVVSVGVSVACAWGASINVMVQGRGDEGGEFDDISTRHRRD